MKDAPTEEENNSLQLKVRKRGHEFCESLLHLDVCNELLMWNAQ
jgi:hypothetical protein